jgi:23S rRNA (guanosine2251-2'-O)-methyltransferase
MSQDLLYGIHAIEKLLKQSPEAVYCISVQKGPLNKRVQSLVNQARKLGLVVQMEPKTFFTKLEGVHQGVVANVAKQAPLKESNLTELIESLENPLFLFLDEVQDPHNLGAILRTADAAGVDAVIIPKHNSVGMTATVKKVASGAAETVKLIVVSNLTRTIKDMQKQGMWMIGLDGETDKTIYEIDFKGSIGLVMGAEGTGLRKLTKETCDYLAAIPMQGSVESLNVSVATGVTLYEALRQRN